MMRPWLFLAALGLMPLPWLHIDANVSDSLPIEKMLVGPAWMVSRGDVVEACAPGMTVPLARGYVGRGNCPSGAYPLVKVVAAIAGDVIWIDNRGFSVNGRLLPNSTAIPNDSKGRPMVAQPYGTRYLQPGEVWLYGTNRSLDSRYFGAVRDVRGRVLAYTSHGKVPDLR